MRLWTLHPRYLDQKGLCGLWREAIMAQNVIHGLTSGYKNHPQLIRFKNNKSLIHDYLLAVFDESLERGYNFNSGNIIPLKKLEPLFLIPVTLGQVNYEIKLLIHKLQKRGRSTEFLKSGIELFPIFHIIPGDIESWEKVKEF